jgi:Alginate lyase
MCRHGHISTSLVLLILVTILFYNNGEKHVEKRLITDPEFRHGTEPVPIAIYRLIGNDMPPLQSRGQLRWNTQYALDNERQFRLTQKRWVLNRIWNETEFELIYGSLIKAGVHRRDILVRCFDLNEYMKEGKVEDRLLYLTSQNEARNEAIMDGRMTGFEWSLILDGNTFIPDDTWEGTIYGLMAAQQSKLQYLKIPYHRVHYEQSTSWLNASTSIETILQFAPTKGESQMAFHKSASEMFSLDDTNTENFMLGKTKSTKGYGQRNKSYMFKRDQICGYNSRVCGCVRYPDSNEENADKITETMKLEYAHLCGLVVRLWNYPTHEVISTGIPPDMEEGFFCYLDEVRHDISYINECELLHQAASFWMQYGPQERKIYRANATACKEAHTLAYLTNSCFRSAAREIAQNNTNHILESLSVAQRGIKGKTKASTRPSLCQKVQDRSTRADQPLRKHFLVVFNETTLAAEKATWTDSGSSGYDALKPLIDKLLRLADRGLGLGPYSVTNKKRRPRGVDDVHHYHSVRPFFWPIDDCPQDLKEDIKSGKVEADDGYVRRDGVRLPGTIIGTEHDDNYDRAAAWYMVDNVTTLALAWHFTGDKKYSDYGATLVRTFFLDPMTGMYPSLDYAQDGDWMGLIDWKDFFYLTDAFTLLERSGSLSSVDVAELQTWCGVLAKWILRSSQGSEEAKSLNHFGVYVDQTLLALAIYARDDQLVDVVRSRLRYRLTKPFPLGHFGLRLGAQLHEIGRATALHYITFNLLGWVHLALMCEAIKNNDVLLQSMESLIWLRHEGDPDGDPVLMKAIRWLSQWLPPATSHYETLAMPVKGMHVEFPYEQENEFAFDVMLEVVQFGVGVYGAKRLFGDFPSPEITIALAYPKYSVDRASMGDFSSVYPDSGSRAWSALGVYQRKIAVKNGETVDIAATVIAKPPSKDAPLLSKKGPTTSGGQGTAIDEGI